MKWVRWWWWWGWDVPGDNGIDDSHYGAIKEYLLVILFQWLWYAYWWWRDWSFLMTIMINGNSMVEAQHPLPLNSKDPVSNSVYDILCNLGCLAAGEGWRPVGAHLIHLLVWQMRQFRPREMRCPPLPVWRVWQARVGSQASWHPVPGLFPSAVQLQSLQKGPFIPPLSTVCPFTCAQVFSWFIPPKRQHSRATSPIFKELFCENQALGIPL